MKKIVPFETILEEKLEVAQGEMVLPPLLSIYEVCDYLGLGRTLVSEMLRKGEIPHTKIRNRVRIFATDLRAYLDKRKVGEIAPKKERRADELHKLFYSELVNE